MYRNDRVRLPFTRGVANSWCFIHQIEGFWVLIWNLGSEIHIGHVCSSYGWSKCPKRAFLSTLTTATVFQFSKLFYGGNGLSIPQNDRKWVTNLNPEPFLQYLNHIWDINFGHIRWPHDGLFLFCAEELGLNIRRPNSPNIGLLGHRNRPIGKSACVRNWGKRTPY